MKNILLILISILIVVFCVIGIFWYFSGSKTTAPVTMSEAKAIETIKNQFPEFKEYPSDNLPPKSIKTQKAEDGWYVAFVQEGSGRPIILAKCYFIDNTKKVTSTGVFSPKYSEYGIDNISFTNCQPKDLSPKPGGEISPNSKQKPCTEEAKVCPDGSSVSRTGPDCEFAECPFGNDQIEKSITDYLLTQSHFSWKTASDSRNFCVIENLNPTSEGLFPMYLWVRCGEFILQNGKLNELSGVSVPAKIDYPNQLSFYDLSKFSYEAPRDGSLYSKDIKTIFPLNVQKAISTFDIANINKKIESVALSGLEK